MKIAEFANSTDLDEAAHNELPHLQIYCFALHFNTSHEQTQTKSVIFISLVFAS